MLSPLHVFNLHSVFLHRPNPSPVLISWIKKTLVAFYQDKKETKIEDTLTFE